MSDPDKPPRRSAADQRAERLAAELRANLSRRKQQSRLRAAAEAAPGPAEADLPSPLPAPCLPRDGEDAAG